MFKFKFKFKYLLSSKQSYIYKSGQFIAVKLLIRCFNDMGVSRRVYTLFSGWPRFSSDKQWNMKKRDVWSGGLLVRWTVNGFW